MARGLWDDNNNDILLFNYFFVCSFFENFLARIVPFFMFGPKNLTEQIFLFSTQIFCNFLVRNDHFCQK